MKLNTQAMRYLSDEDWRVLTAVEQGSKNHEVVPTPLIVRISGLRGGSGVHKCISQLAKNNLIAKVKNAKYDGYRLTYGGFDYLALHTYRKRKDVYSVGNQIGVGKESDIFVVADERGTQRVLKVHRLGRISFRTVKANRDYLRNRSSGSWMHMSKLAALKEFTFMKALRENGFPVPEPLAQSRHTIVMSLIDAFPLRQIPPVSEPSALYTELISIIITLAEVGLIHGDFNEFNILMKEERGPFAAAKGSTDSSEDDVKLVPILIDFPQMISVDHANAEMYFDRDVNCIKNFFQRRFNFVSDTQGPFLAEIRKRIGINHRLDVTVEASGFSKNMARELESYLNESKDVDAGLVSEYYDDDSDQQSEGERPEDEPAIGVVD